MSIVYTWRKATPTATPATVSRLFSNHSSPAIKQPFSLIIFWTSSLYQNKKNMPNYKKTHKKDKTPLPCLKNKINTNLKNESK